MISKLNIKFSINFFLHNNGCKSGCKKSYQGKQNADNDKKWCFQIGQQKHCCYWYTDQGHQQIAIQFMCDNLQKMEKISKKMLKQIPKNNRCLKGEIKPPGSTKFILVLFLPSYLNGAMNMLYTSTSKGCSVGITPACGPRDLDSSPAWEN